jgi:CMP/dCMP kinase
MRVIAIDGPAGSGKSTVAKALAARLGLGYLDTGAMYRAVTFAALRAGVEPSDAEPVVRIAKAVDLDVGIDEVLVDGVDATTAIRGPEVSRAVSIVAANPGVRAEMRRRQREWAHERGGGVLEGRDIGTVVFPDAALKVYLTARPEVRAARRAKESEQLDYDTVAADMARRDALDSRRADSPLREAEGATIVDTTDLDVDEVVALLLELLDA